MKMLIIGVGILTVIVLSLVIITSLSSGSEVSKEPFIKAAQQQAEIIRVSQAQYSKVSDPDVQNFVINTQLSLTSDQQTLNELLGKLRVKVSAKELQLGANKATDETLASAAASSTLNAALTQELQNELERYQNSLKVAYNSVTGPKTRQTIQQLYDHAGLLIEQSKQ